MQDLQIAYLATGRLNAARDNAILLCHGASGRREWAQPFCRPGGAFDPDRWYVISADMPGGGGSSRASTTAGFPPSYGIRDLTRATAALIEKLELGPLRAFCGQSMGGLVGLDLAVHRPELVRSLALWVCGYRCDGFGRALIEALRAILTIDGSSAGMRAAAGALLPALLDRALLATMSGSAQRALVEQVAQDWIANWRADELIARYSAIADCDLAARCGDESRLAAAIRCPVLWLLSSSDQVFAPHEARAFASSIANASVRLLSTAQGHLAAAASPTTPEFSFFDRGTAAFLRELPA